MRTTHGLRSLLAELAPLNAAGRWPGTVRLWHLDLKALPEDAAAFHAVLTEDERARAGRLRHEADRHRFLATRAALRLLLGHSLDCDPGALRLRIGPYGRPALVDEGPHFNVSHAGDHAVFALSADREVGIDIESCERLTDWTEVRDLVCGAAERATLDALSPEDARLAFYRCWTAKEAVLKALGTGFAAEPRTVGVRPMDGTQRPWIDAATLALARDPPLESVAGTRAPLSICWLDEIARHCICLCWEDDAALS